MRHTSARTNLREQGFSGAGADVASQHAMTSGALPPAFPAVRVGEGLYRDGGIYSNTPIEAVLDDQPRRDSLIIAVQLWNPQDDAPDSIWQVMGRHKDIQYASRADSHIARQQQIHRLRHGRIDARQVFAQAPWRHEDGAMHEDVHVHDHLSRCSTG